MTIGERIAQIRKVKGLSQEAFGESLGVTRQSISKWEANISIPEMDKLLAMCKLYEVSVSWLLGEETEDLNENQEMTENQWNMVERIAEKYIASIPQQKSKSKIWHKVVAIGMVLAMVFGMIYLANSVHVLNEKLAGMENNLNIYRNEVSNQLANMTSVIDVIEFTSQEQEQESILSEYSALPCIDVSTQTVTYEMWAMPKKCVEDMRVEFVFRNNDEVYRFEGVDEDNMSRFSASCPMPISDCIEVYVVLHMNGEQQSQKLTTDYDLDERTKVATYGSSGSLLSRNIGRISEKKEPVQLKKALYNDIESNTASAQSVLFKFYKNEELIEAVDGVLGEETPYVEQTGFILDTAVLPNTKMATAELDYEVFSSLEKGDSFWVVIIVTDNYDREYVVGIDTYRVSDEMILELEENESLWYGDPKWFE